MRSVPSPDSPGGLAEFHLADLKTSNAGEYACEYYRRGSRHIGSPPSDVLLLLVTGGDRVLRMTYGLPSTGMREDERGRGSHLQCAWGGGDGQRQEQS